MLSLFFSNRFMYPIVFGLLCYWNNFCIAWKLQGKERKPKKHSPFTFHIFKKNTALKWTNYLVLGWSFLTEHYLAPMKLSTNAFSSLIPSKQRKPTWWMEVGEGGREAVCRLNHTLSGFLSSSQLSILQRCSGLCHLEFCLYFQHENVDVSKPWWTT